MNKPIFGSCASDATNGASSVRGHPPLPPLVRGGRGGGPVRRSIGSAAFSKAVYFAFLFVFGCDAPVAIESPDPSLESAVTSRFDAGRTGSISGRVCWNGTIPEYPAIDAAIVHADGKV